MPHQKFLCMHARTNRATTFKASLICTITWSPRSRWWTSRFFRPHLTPALFSGRVPCPFIRIRRSFIPLSRATRSLTPLASLGKGDAVLLRGHGSMVVAQSVEWVFAACVDLEEAASRFYKAAFLGPVLVYNDDETQRVMRGRRKDSVVQKIWDHNVAKTKLAGLMAAI